jgi:hypothetical protein
MPQTIHSVDRHWMDHFKAAAQHCGGRLRIMCPFITTKALKRILDFGSYSDIQVLTRFDLADWANGVSDPDALRVLLERHAWVRGVRRLHSKLFIFAPDTAIVGSTNLTVAALEKNHELGFVVSDKLTIGRCEAYFEEMWALAKPDLTADDLARYRAELASLTKQSASRRGGPTLPDHGVDVGFEGPLGIVTAEFMSTADAIVKFFGTTDNRFTWDVSILEELRRSGCHWACGYPASRRPINVRDGTEVFLGRLMKEPADTVIFGRARATRYVRGRDDATPEDIGDAGWREDWPHYIRVHDAQFVAGTFRNGVPLSRLMKELGSDSFASTQQHAAEGRGNSNPRAALRQQPAVRLSRQGRGYLANALEIAFRIHGRIAQADIDQLYLPNGMAWLSPEAHAILIVILRAFATGRINASEPSSFFTYGEMLEAIGVRPVEGPERGRQLRRNGLDDLDRWTRNYLLPAVSGFVVTNKGASRRPDDTFFSLHGRGPADIGWWLQEMKKASDFNWTCLISG